MDKEVRGLLFGVAIGVVAAFAPLAIMYNNLRAEHDELKVEHAEYREHAADLLETAIGLHNTAIGLHNLASTYKELYERAVQ